MSFPSDKWLTCLLAVSVLAGSVAPAGYFHAHRGGHLPHQHHKDKGRIDHVHRHDGHAHHVDGQHARHGSTPAAEAPREFAEVSRHWHVTLLFWELVLPALPLPEGGSENDRHQPLVVMRLFDLSVVTATESVSSRLTGREFSGSRRIETVAPAFSLPTPHPPLSRILLCDTARRERSGVLLS